MSEQENAPAKLAVKYGVSLTEAKVLNALIQSDVPLTTADLAEVMGNKSNPKMYVLRLRKALEPHKIVIGSRPYVGYWIESPDAAQLREEAN